MIIKAKSFRKIILLLLYFFTWCSPVSNFNFAQQVEQDSLAKARELYKEGDYNTAIGLLKIFIRQNEDIPEQKRKVVEAYYFIVEIYLEQDEYKGLEQEKYKEADYYLERFFKKFPGLKVDESKSVIKKRLEIIKRKVIDEYYSEAKTHYNEGDDIKCNEILRKVFQISPEFGKDEIDTGFRERVDQVKKIIEAENIYLEAKICYSNEEHQKAEEYLRMVLRMRPGFSIEETDPNFIQKVEEVRKKLAEDLYVIAKNNYSKGNSSKVDENLTKVFIILPDFSKEETDPDFKKKVEQIKKEVKESFKKTDVQEKGIKVVFIVDVSSSLRKQEQLIINFVEKLIDLLEEDIEEKEYHLVTFCEEPKLFKLVNKEVILEEIKNEIKRNKHKSYTYPSYALIQSFELIENNFPQKVGIVIFISDGEDSRYEYDKRNKYIKKTEFRKAHDDLGQVITAIKKIGFNIYNVFIDGDKRYSCKECMEMLAKLSGQNLTEIKTQSEISFKINHLKNKITNAKFISPAPREEVKKLKTKWSRDEMKLRNQIEHTGNRIKIALVLLGVISMGIVIFWIRRLKIRKLIEEEEKRKLNMLWGKLIDPQKQVIDLSRKPPGFKLKPAKNKKFPILEFQPAKCRGKKAIKINHEEGRVKFLKKDKKKETSNHYIDMDTCYFKVFHSQEKKSSEYEYIFLNRLLESCKNPVWEKADFKGRHTLLKEIKENFLKETEDCYHYLISGMGNSGKTSLMNHLYHFSLGEDDKIKQKYRLALVEFNPKDYSTFSDLETNIKDQLNSSKGGNKNLILIDEYDKLYEKFPGDFGDFIKEKTSTFDYFFIFSGRKGSELLKNELSVKGYENLLPHYLTHKRLKGLDDFEANSAKTYKKSLELIDYLISDIGLPKSVLEEDVKCKIATYASGFPSLIKRILFVLIIYWLSNYNEKTIKAHHVEDAVFKVKRQAKAFLLRRACEYDERNYEELPAPLATEVRIRDILNILSECFKGVAPKEAIKNMLIKHRGDDKKIEDGRKKSFDRKIKQLKDMGFIKESKENFIGIPYMFFYRGEKIIETE